MSTRASIKEQARAEFEKAVIEPRGYSKERNKNGLYVQKGLQKKWRLYCQGFTDAVEQQVTTLHLLADIREACRDRGKRMQGDLVKHIRALTDKAELWDELQRKQPEAN